MKNKMKRIKIKYFNLLIKVRIWKVNWILKIYKFFPNKISRIISKLIIIVIQIQ